MVGNKQNEMISCVCSMGAELLESSGSDIQEIPSDSLHWAEAFPELEEEEKNLPGLMLREARKRLGLKQRDVATKTGIPQPHLLQMEKGKRPIGEQNAKKLAHVLNVGYRVFLS